MKNSSLLFPIVVLALGVGCSQPVKNPPGASMVIAGATVVPTPSPPAPPAAIAVAVAVPNAGASTLASDTPPPVLDAARRDAFIAEAAQASGMPSSEVRAWLDQAQYKQSIINAITRPAEGKPWKDYRPIFLTDARIQQGRQFYAENRSDIERVAGQTGVPGAFIVAIIGVETSYGRITGTYRVLDALYTLAFFYPKREEFFRGELLHLFSLAREERLDLATLKGSYAGAMGWGQFMPSSYRNFARDGDGDGRRDLLASRVDAFASIANYFIAHGWQRGQLVMLRAVPDAGAAPFVPDNLEAKYPLADLAARGYRPGVAGVPDLPATLLTLQGVSGPEYWFGFRNFYVITRYNRSPMYATAVTQLAGEIAAGAGAPP